MARPDVERPPETWCRECGRTTYAWTPGSLCGSCQATRKLSRAAKRAKVTQLSVFDLLDTPAPPVLPPDRYDPSTAEIPF